MNNKINELLNENVSLKENCNLCKEVSLETGQRTDYGSIIIYQIGGSFENGWFATLSPRTGGNPEKDFTVQLMPFAHLTHFSQISSYLELAKNYGIAFSKINEAMTKIMAEELNFKTTADSRELAVSIATYGKCTNWKEKKEHLHIKIFPFRGNIGQPYTVDSSFGKKEIYQTHQTDEEFVKMNPVKKIMIKKERFDWLAKKFILYLK